MAVVKQDLSPEEISRRTAALKRFRELLKAQRDRFQTYLDVLDRQKTMIEKGNAEDLIRHVELEEKIVADILSIQKVIDPMEHLYRAVNKGSGKVLKENDEVADIKSALENLKKEAAARSERNKNLLSKRMIELRSEIKSIRADPYNRQRSAYSNQGVASVVDIKG